MTTVSDRKEILFMIDEAIESGARQSLACQTLGIAERTIQRWRLDTLAIGDLRPVAERPAPANKLTDAERQAILDAANAPCFRSLPPSQIVPALLDQGCYIASESSFYRELKKADMLHHRGRANKPHKRHKPTSYVATGPNQVWSWDITYLPSEIRGKYYYLYLVIDIFSRMIVAWEIHECESSDFAAKMLQQAYLKHGIGLLDNLLVLHSDNGGPMKGSTMLATMHSLGVVPSFNRPRVSNDNPYSESMFRTLKYRPSYPSKPFESLVASRQWVDGFVKWYNEEHKHSALKFTTPYQRHYGQTEQCLMKRKKVMEAAKARQPKRWGSRTTRNWDLPEEVWLNPDESNHNGLPSKAA
jgi:putative transposase